MKTGKKALSQSIGDVSPLISSSEFPISWPMVAIHSFTRHHSGNSKLIKGKLHSSPNKEHFAAFSASGQDVWHEKFEHEGDAVIVSAVGARCGKCFLAQGRWSAIANTHVVWPDLTKVDVKFLWYLLNDEQFWIRSGSAQPFVAVRKTFEKEIPLPTLHEQQRIVGEIEKQFTRLDAGVKALKRVQANLKRYRAAVLKSACEGRLVPTEAELARKTKRPYETGGQLIARILREREKNWQGRGKYKSPAAPDTTNLPSLPDGWTWATIEQLSTIVQYGSSAKTNDDINGVPVLRMGNIQDGAFTFDFLKYLPTKHEEFPDLFLSKGDLLFNRTNSAELVGKSAIFKGTLTPCSFASYLIRVRFSKNSISDYINFYINSSFGRAWIASVVSQQVGQANVNGTKLQALAIPLPPLDEQTRIVAEVECRLSIIDELETQLKTTQSRATHLRQSILRQSFAHAPNR